MFGSELWREAPSEHLQKVAKACFRQYANLISDFHQQGLLTQDEEPLRLAQVMWATLHGLVKLTHDGIFVSIWHDYHMVFSTRKTLRTLEQVCCCLIDMLGYRD